MKWPVVLQRASTLIFRVLGCLLFHFVAGLQKLGEPFCDGYSACYLDGIFNSINVGQCSTLGQPGRAHVFPNRSVRVNAAAKAMLGERRSRPAVAGLGCAQGSGLFCVPNGGGLDLRGYT